MAGAPVWADDEEMLTIRPQPASTMSGISSWVTRKGPLRLIAIMRSQEASLMLVKGS